MKAPSLLFVGLNPEARATAAEAARMAFSGATLTDAPSVDEAQKMQSAAEPELLVLFEPDPAALTRAVNTTDAWGLPRWSVVVLGNDAVEGGVDVAAVLGWEDWNARWVAQVFRSAARWHGLKRENVRLHGDLSTIGRRINHDLRTPLGAINAACEAINEIMGSHAQEHAVFTQSIATSANELAQLLERVSALVKASAEPIPCGVVSMRDVVFDALQRLESSMLARRATITQPAAWPQVTGVAAWSEIVWYNLLANSLQHAQAAPQIELGWSEAPGGFRFWVNDRGPGVAQQKIGKLFQPFHALHRLDAPRGLGLALVQRLVELQGGACGYAPLEGGGAHFFFTLPAVVSP